MIESGAGDQPFMQRALALAHEAAAAGEVPIGAVVVRDGRIIGEGFNQPIASVDPTAHAEIVALRAACVAANNYRLPEADLYVTLEPCRMCAGALVHARIRTLVFAAAEPRAGAVCSTCSLLDEPGLNHRVSWRRGPLEEDAAALLRDFFRARRQGSG